MSEPVASAVHSNGPKRLAGSNGPGCSSGAPDQLPLPGGGRTLVLGAGGGFDVLAAEMVRQALLRRRPERDVDVAGLLNPRFEHHYVRGGEVAAERAVNLAAGVARFRRASLDEPPRRYADRVREGRMKRMPDAELARITGRALYHLSTRFGLDEPVDFAARYDVVVACDVGGDILYGGARDNMVRTPLMDAFSLALLAQAEARGAAAYVLLLGPGTDGELPAERLGAAIAALDRRGAIVREGRPSTRDLAILAGLLAQCGGGMTGGKTLRLMGAVRAALRTGERLPALAGRDMEEFRPWVDRAYLLAGAAVASWNPLAAGDSMEAIGAIASALGWSEPGEREPETRPEADRPAHREAHP